MSPCGSPTSPDITVAVKGSGNLVKGMAYMDFGRLRWPSTAERTQTLMISNSGNAPLTGLALALSGIAPEDFSTSKLASTTLAPGASTSINVRFSPKSSGHRGALLTVTSNDPDETPFLIVLGGFANATDRFFNPDANGDVDALAIQSDGKILMAGNFTTVGAMKRTHIARINTNGTLDSSFRLNVDHRILTLAIQADGKILIAGEFTSVGGKKHAHIARLHSDGTVDRSFNPNADDRVYSLAVQPDGKILMAGEFSKVNGVKSKWIARLNTNGTLDNTFTPDLDYYIAAIAVQKDGKILIGGGFHEVNRVARSNIARLNADGTLDRSFDPVTDDTVYSVVVQPDGKILIGGFFTTVEDASRQWITRLNTDGTLDRSFNARADGYISSIAVQMDGRILIGGWFTRVGGLEHNNIARLNPDGTPDSAFNPEVNGAVNALAVQPDGEILIGGWFTAVDGKKRNHIARLHNTPSPSKHKVIPANRNSKPDIIGQTAFDQPSTQLETWQQKHFGINAANPLISAWAADPDRDGIPNLMEHAFNLSPLQSDASILTAGTGSSGLPLIRRTESPPTFSIQYIRLKPSTNPELIYLPQVSSSPDGAWSAFTGTETVETIDENWERVTVMESVKGQQTRFGRVKVSTSGN